MVQSLSRIKQYHDNGNLWQYIIKNERCSCGCNVFYHVYDKPKNKVFVVCNVCDDIIAEVKEEYTQKELKKGVWK